MAYRETEKMRQRKAEARKRIVDCTYQCVAEGGFRSSRVTRIAGLAGVATGTIYRHFESREDLFAEIFRLATQREVDKVAEALASDGNAGQPGDPGNPRASKTAFGHALISAVHNPFARLRLALAHFFRFSIGHSGSL